LFLGPIFTREAVTLPRRPRMYVARATYVLALFVLMCTAWMILPGTQVVSALSTLATFGAILFQILAPLQLALAVFFAALSAASAVARDKDRRTLDLLLLTDISNSELVLGRLVASLLGVFVLLAAAIPLFMLALLFGGVSPGQVARVEAVTLVSVLAAGSLGSTLAFWREKTFQTLALTALGLGAWIVAWEAIALAAPEQVWLGIDCLDWAIVLSPWQAILEASRPAAEGESLSSLMSPAVAAFLAVALGLTAAISGIAVWRVRVWNPAREGQRRGIRKRRERQATRSLDAAPPVKTAGSSRPMAIEGGEPILRGPTRPVWDNPIVWREIRTRAYGRRVLVIRVAYWCLFILAAAGVYTLVHGEVGITRAWGVTVLAPLLLLSIVLVNAQAVTALTSERDARALDLLLVTDLTPKEFIFGKLAGILYNAKEMVVLPILLCAYLWLARAISLENFVYLIGALVVLDAFVAVLGMHLGMAYENSQRAILASLGTVFFLFLGVATCIRMMVAFSGSFQVQLQPFLAFMAGGGLALYVTLGARTRSTAIALASAICPLATFYAITSFLLDYTLAVFLVTASAYGFATAAMLVPAVYEFDVATGRTTAPEE